MTSLNSCTWPRFTGRRRPFLSRIKVSHTSRLPHPGRGSPQKRRAAPQKGPEAETCHHIPLNESGQTLEMLYSRGITKEELFSSTATLVTFDSPSARIGGIGRTEQPMHRQGMEKCRKPLPEAKTQSRIPGGKRSSASPDHHPTNELRQRSSRPLHLIANGLRPIAMSAQQHGVFDQGRA